MLNRLVARYPNRIVLALNSRSQLCGNPFDDIQGLEAALEFLATTFWDARLGDLSGIDLDAGLRRDAPGFSYTPHQSKRTMGVHPDDYYAHWEGRKYELKAHLGKGKSHDPRHCVRIAFAVDRERDRIVIGYFGQHQRTRAS